MIMVIGIVLAFSMPALMQATESKNQQNQGAASKIVKIYANNRAELNQLANIIGAINNDQTFSKKESKLADLGGTRSGSDRRKYKYMHYPAERRSGKERRKTVVRSGEVARKKILESRFCLNNEEPFPRKRKYIFETILHPNYFGMAA
jgi:hypothetical protein